MKTFSLNQDNDDKVTKNKERRCSRWCLFIKKSINLFMPSETVWLHFMYLNMFLPVCSLWIVIITHYHDFLQVWFGSDSYWYVWGSLLFHLCIASYKICNWQGIYSCQCGKRLYEIMKLFAPELRLPYRHLVLEQVYNLHKIIYNLGISTVP